MPEESNEDRTEEPTPRRREEARKEGQVARSQDFTSAVMLFAALGIMLVTGPLLLEALRGAAREAIRCAGEGNLSAETLPAILLRVVGRPATVLLLILVLSALVAVVVGVLQVGFFFTPELLSPKWSRVSPLNALKRIFSLQGIMIVVVGVLKIIVVSWLAYSYLSAVAGSAPAISREPLWNIMPLLGRHVLALGVRVMPALLLIGTLDFLYQWWNNEQKLKMTKQELKEEMKRTEGDPLIKQHIRQIQRQRALQRMMAEVPKATVVVTNPTHVAVALKYAAGETRAPVVTAKGMRLVAERIKALAYRYEVPVMEEPPLARALFKAVEVGEEIPPEFYRALAEILAVVFRRTRPAPALVSPSAPALGAAAGAGIAPAETAGVAGAAGTADTEKNTGASGLAEKEAFLRALVYDPRSRFLVKEQVPAGDSTDSTAAAAAAAAAAVEVAGAGASASVGVIAADGGKDGDG